MVTLAAGGLPAQDTATQQEIDKLTGTLQDLTERLDAQDKSLKELERQISDLRDKVNTPVANNSASADDLQKLAGQVKTIDQKRQDDRELILGKIQELAKLVANAPVAAHPHHPTGDAPVSDNPPATAGTQKEKGYEYKVQAGDSLTAIVQACKEKGLNMTLTKLLKANPGMTSSTPLYVGKTIFIPDPSAK